MQHPNSVEISIEQDEGRIDQKINSSYTGMTICGKTIDCVRGITIPNVGIKLTDTEYNPLFHTSSDNNGEFIFTNLPFQYYILLSSHEDYYPSTSKLINPCPEHNFHRILLSPLPQCKKNIIIGKITDINDTPLENCTIKLLSKNSPIISCCTTTDCNGEYVITYNKRYNINYYLLVKRNMYKDELIDIPGVYNKIDYINITLSIDEYCGGTISGIITDVTGNSVPNCIVILFDADQNKPISFTYTNKTGCYLFYNIKTGNYYIKSNKQCENYYKCFGEAFLNTSDFKP